MKHLIYILISVALALGSISCSREGKIKESQKWEYKIISSWGVDRSDYLSKGIPVPENELNKLGDEGWELVDVYTRIETVHPNFGNAKYVTGLQPNTRTEAVFYVLKRPKNENSSQSSESNSGATEEVSVEETPAEYADTCCAS